jgi:phosphoribosyl 1,2-cyclic phosphate phosphodiesterase
VCHSTDPRDKRLRTSALVQVECSDAGNASAGSSGAGSSDSGECNAEQPLNIVIDAGPDFRTQMLAAGVTCLDAILLTHEHKDHTGGIDDVRAFNYFTQTPLDIWATQRVQDAVRKDYYYAFEEHPYPGAPEITLHTIPDGRNADGGDDHGESFNVKGIEIIPIRGMHMRLPVTGFRIGKLAYLTDFNHIEDSEVEKLRGVEVLVVNALGHREHISHFNLTQALDLARRVGAPRTFLTHVAHRMGLYAEIDPTLPEGVHFAYDGLTVMVND